MKTKYPVTIGKTIGWMKCNGSTIFKVVYDIGGEPEQGAISFIYDFSKGVLYDAWINSGECKDIYEGSYDITADFEVIVGDMEKFNECRKQYNKFIDQWQEIMRTGKNLIESEKENIMIIYTEGQEIGKKYKEFLKVVTMDQLEDVNEVEIDIADFTPILRDIIKIIHS